MLLDAFLKIDGIEGECTDDEHKGEVEILAFDHLIENSSSNIEGEKNQAFHGSFTVMKAIDKISPQLYQRCCSGKVIPKVILSLCHPTGKATSATDQWKKEVFLTIELQKAHIVRVNPKGDASEGPYEQIDFSYQAIKWNYLSPTANMASWNLKTNAPIAG